MANPDKEQLVQIVNTWLVRSQLSVRQVIERMQARGCPIDRTRFENRFTTRLEQRPNVPPAWTLALVAAFTEGLTAHERATAEEAIRLAKLARLPIDQFQELRSCFPTDEFLAAYRRFAPSAGCKARHSRSPARRPPWPRPAPPRPAPTAACSPSASKTRPSFRA
jgi:hypothetical protein